MVSWTTPEKYCQEVEGGDPSSLYSTGETKAQESGFGVFSMRNKDILDTVDVSMLTKGHKDG